MKLHRLLILISLHVVASNLEAQVDQANYSQSLNCINVLYGVQQEFTPDLDSLNAVIISFSTWLLPTYAGTLVVHIRQGGINGDVIGTSDPVSLPPAFGGNVLFSFPEPVTLTPHSIYALEPVKTSGSPQGYMLNVNPGYPGGRLFYGGGFFDSDLAFQEGINIVPEPSPLALLALAACVLLPIVARNRRTLFRESGDDELTHQRQRARR